MPGLQNLRFLPSLGIGTSGVREFERWCAPKFEQDLRFTSLMDINLDLSSLADLYARHLVDDLRELCACFTLTGFVRDSCDGECARLLGYASEIRVGGFCFPLYAFKVIEYLERRGSRQRVGYSLSNAVVGPGFQWIYRWNVVDLDLDMRCTVFCLLLTTTRVTNFAHADLVGSKREDVVGYSEVVVVGVDVLNLYRIRSRVALVLDIDFKIERSNALQSYWNDLVAR